MRQSPPFSEVSRRALLSTLAALPALSSALLSASALAQTMTPGDPLPSWNDGAAKQAILDFVASRPTGKPEFRAARGAHRHLRSGRHALGRAPDVHAGGLLPGPRPGGGRRRPELGTSSRSRPCSREIERRSPSFRCPIREIWRRR